MYTGVNVSSPETWSLRLPARADLSVSLYGFGVDIAHGGGMVTRYCHFKSASTVFGTVRAGDAVGLAGATGRGVTGVHTHVSVLPKGFGSEERLEYFDLVDEGGRPTEENKDGGGC